MCGRSAAGDQMLTGRRPFAGEDTSATLASVLRDDPDLAIAAGSRDAARDRAAPVARKGSAAAAAGHGRREAPDDRCGGVARWPAGKGRAASTPMVDRRRGGAWRRRGGRVGRGRGVLAARRDPGFASGTVPAPVICAAAFDRTSRQECCDLSRRHAQRGHDRQAAQHSAGRAAHRSLGGMVIGSAYRGRDSFFSDDGRQVGYATLDELRRVSVEGGPSVKDCGLSVVFLGGSWGSGRLDCLRTGRRTRIVSGPGRPAANRSPSWHRTRRRTNAITSVRWCFRMAARFLYMVALRGGRTRIVARRSSAEDPITVVEPGFGAVYLTSCIS